jgi:hypothetical protein
VKAKFATGPEGARKELRQFPVATIPSLGMLITSTKRDRTHEDSGAGEIQTKHYGLLPLTEGTQGDDTLNIIFDGVFKLVDNARLSSVEAIKVKVTSKTVCRVTGHSLRECITEVLKSELDRTGHPTNLETIIRRLQCSDSLVRSRDPQYFSSLIKLVKDLGTDPWIYQLELIEAFREQWCNGPCQLELKTKVYWSRADERAYVHCHDPVAHLTGAILQGLLMPADRQRYRNCYFGRCVRRVGKNIINRTFKLAYQNTLRVILLDIASFTSSCVNSGLIVLAMWVQLNEQEALSKLKSPMLYKLGGEFFEASLEEVFGMYIASTLFAPIDVVETGARTFAMGGYLGIPANLALTMYALLIVLKDIQDLARTRQMTMIIDPGGDDVEIILAGPGSSVDEIEEAIRSNLTKFIGRLKEFVVTDIHPGDQNILVGEFCKKEVTCTWTDGVVTLQSHFQLPILDALLSPLSQMQAIRQTSQFLYCLTDALRHLSNVDLFEAFVRAYEEKHTVSVLKISRRQVLATPETGFFQIDDRVLSEAAVTILRKVKPFYWCGMAYRSSMQQRLEKALSDDTVTEREFCRFKAVVASKGEFRKRTVQERIFRSFTEEADVASRALQEILTLFHQ